MHTKAWGAVAVAVVIGSCAQPALPVLELTLSPKTVNDGTPVRVRVVGTRADGKIGTGTVKVTSKRGTLTPAEIQLDRFGVGVLELVCNPAVDGECAGPTLVTATWTSESVTVTAEALLNATGAATGGGTGTGGGAAGGGAGGGAAMLVPCSAMDFNFGAAVALQQPTATFSQSSFGPFTVSRSVDGMVSDGYGWASDQQLTRSQTAAFETVSDTTQQNGTRLLFLLQHTFSVEHALGKFRIAVTTAARTAFADGNEGLTVPGEVGAPGIWQVLTPRRLCATNSATLRVLGDGSILANDLNSAMVVYAFEADTPLNGITGVRLEALQDNSLPFNGPGLQNSNGNFVLSEFSVRVGDPL